MSKLSIAFTHLPFSEGMTGPAGGIFRMNRRKNRIKKVSEDTLTNF